MVIGMDSASKKLYSLFLVQGVQKILLEFLFAQVLIVFSLCSEDTVWVYILIRIPSSDYDFSSHEGTVLNI